VVLAPWHLGQSGSLRKPENKRFLVRPARQLYGWLNMQARSSPARPASQTGYVAVAPEAPYSQNSQSLAGPQSRQGIAVRPANGLPVASSKFLSCAYFFADLNLHFLPMENPDNFYRGFHRREGQ